MADRETREAGDRSDVERHGMTADRAQREPIIKNQSYVARDNKSAGDQDISRRLSVQRGGDFIEIDVAQDVQQDNRGSDQCY